MTSIHQVPDIDEGEIDEQTRREREEIAAALREPSDESLEDLERFAISFVHRIPTPPREPAPPDPAEIERRRVEARINNLRAVRDPDAVALIAPAREGPAVAGHAGSKAAFAGVDDFLASPRKRTLTLRGPTGTGKTYGAIWAVAQTPDSYFLVADDCQCDIEEWKEKRRKAIHCALLIVNDLGTEPDWTVDRLAPLIERRHDEGRRTIITTNLPIRASPEVLARNGATEKDHIHGRYGDRLSDRLLDDELSMVVTCSGSTLRRGAKN